MSDKDNVETTSSAARLPTIAGIKFSIKRWFYYSCDDVINVIADETFMWEELTNNERILGLKITKEQYFKQVIKYLLPIYGINRQSIWIKKSKLREILEEQKELFEAAVEPKDVHITSKKGPAIVIKSRQSVLGFYKVKFKQS